MVGYIGFDPGANSSVTRLVSSTTPLTSVNHADDPVQLYLPFNSDLQDASANNYTMASSGVNVSGDQAKFGGFSGSFSGTNSYVTISGSQSDFQFTDGFTIEFWVYPNSISGHVALVACHNSSGWFIQTHSTFTRFWMNGSNIATTSETIPTGEWTHVAVSRENSGNTVRLFLNGVEKASSASPATIITNRDIFIGAYRSSNGQHLDGYIDDFRIINGVGRYSKSFIPPSQAVGATLNADNETNTTSDFTALYLPFTVDINDDSSHGHTMTAHGNATISSTQSKFGSNAAYFDGSGDYISITSDETELSLGTDDFTFEAYIWLQDLSGFQTIFMTKGGGTNVGHYYLRTNGSKLQLQLGSINNATLLQLNSTTDLVAQEWTHVAATRAGSSVRLFINGTEAGSATDQQGTRSLVSSDFRVGIGFHGSPFQGYINDLRILRGYVKYAGDFVPHTSPIGTSVSETVNDLALLYLPFDATVTAGSGSSAASSLYLPFDSGYGTDDQSSYGHTVTVSGNATTDNAVTAVTGYDGAAARSGYFDGNGDYLTVANHSSLVFGSDDFTVEGFFYASSVGADGLIGMWEDNQRQWLISFSGGTLYAAYSTNGSSATSLSSGVSVSTGQTYHFAFTREGSTFRFFVNGVLKVTSTYSGSLFNTSGALHVGSNGDNLGSLEFHGYLDDLRVIKGTALYTENFSVPTAAVGPTGNPASTTSGGFEDQARNHPVVKGGDVRVNTNVKKFGTSSAYFDGTSGNYLTISHAEDRGDFNFVDEDFTVEGWFYATSNHSFRLIHFGNGSNSFVPILISNSSGTLRFHSSSNASNWNIANGTSFGSLTLHQWFHLAVTRAGTKIRLFKDGTLVNTITSSSSLAHVYDGGINIGGWSQGDNLIGYIDDIRIIRGHAKYTESFTAPTSALGYELKDGGEPTTTAVVDKKELGSVWTLGRGSGQARGKSFINLRKRGRWRKSKLKNNESHRYREGTTESKVAYYAFTSPGEINTSSWTNITRVDYLGVTAGGSGTTGGNRNWSPGSSGDSGTITAHLNQPGSPSSPISVTVGAGFAYTIDGPESAPDSPLTIPSAVQSAFNHYNITGGAAGAQGAGAKGGGPGGGGTPGPANGPGGAGGVSFAVLTSAHPDWTTHDTLSTPEISAVTADLGSPGSSSPHPGAGSYNSGGKGGGGGVGYGAGGGAGAGGAPPSPNPGPQGGNGNGGAGGAGSPGITLVRVQGTVFTAAGGGGGGFSTSGGTQITSGGYKYHVFTTPGTFTMSGGTKDLEYLVVAGGGGGGGSGASDTGAGGGGGAGGLRQGTLPAVAVGSYPVTVGTGGAGTNGQGTAGNNSVFSTITAYGGGAGGSGYPQVAGGAGGSGGGGGGDHGPQPGGTATPGDGGNPGGTSAGPTGDNAGGGGGAGAAGENALGQNPTANRKGGGGGAGAPYPAYAAPIIAPAIPSTAQSAIGPTGLYAGGGGGSTNQSPPAGYGGGPGGPGGGGRGNSPLNTQYGRGEDGVDGTGGGGGGANHQTSPRVGGDGGDGIVIIRYSTS